MRTLAFTAVMALGILVIGTSGAAGPVTYQGKATACESVSFVPPVPSLPCPHVRHSGTIQFLGCVDAAPPAAPSCFVRVTGSASGQGVPLATKQLRAQIHTFDGTALPVSICQTAGTTEGISCAGMAVASLAVPLGECREIRILASFQDVGAPNVAFVFDVQTEIPYRVCNTG